ncbi:MAG: hypothetical protein GKC09_02110 [Methanosarcinales archaeon]|nr:hypothetical protein [Methanosarcinales archaeon]
MAQGQIEHMLSSPWALDEAGRGEDSGADPSSPARETVCSATGPEILEKT